MLFADVAVRPPAAPGKVLMDDNKSSNILDDNDNYDVSYDPSPSSSYQTDRSTPGTSRCSTISSRSSRYRRTYSENSALSEPAESTSCSEEPYPQFWSAAAKLAQNRASLTRFAMEKPRIEEEDAQPEDPEALRLEIRLMKEKLSKLLLGEDMSGSGKGVCSAVTVSNSITNLYATVFGQSLRLEPLAAEQKSMWKREMNCLLSVCDYIVEFFPESQQLQDGAVVEVMSSRPRADIYINLPALKKLDTILLEILDSFKESEFWYAEEGSLGPGLTTLGSSRRLTKRKEDKWWLPVPCVPPGCLSEKSRKQLRHKRDCANQIRKAAMAINSSTLAEMEIPEAYMASLSKTGRAGLGDEIYRYMCTSGKFCPDYLLECLNITTEHRALELADRVEASMYTWKRKAHQSQSKSSWNVVRDLVSDVNKGDKNHLMAERADKLLFCLKQRYPELSQTTLDTSKIQYNRDMGQAILESYSRVLEGLAFNIVSWIEDVLYVDKFTKPQKP